MVQILGSIGKRVVNDDFITQLLRNLSPDDRAGLLEDLAHTPAWIADIFKKVAAKAM
jgi:hypothetical protein